MKSIHERFHSFLIRNGLTVLHVQKIVTEYANSDLELARSHFTEKYAISEHVFYKCRDFAVICCLVDNNTCKRLLKKTCENSRSHNEKNSARASKAHFSELVMKRKEYVLSYSDADIRDIARKYAGGMSAEQIALAYETGKYGINQLLIRGITELIVDKNTLNTIINIMPPNSSFFNTLLEARQETKKNLLSVQFQDTNILKFKIEHYSIYFTGEENKPSISQLEEELKVAQERYEKTLEL